MIRQWRLPSLPFGSEPEGPSADSWAPGLDSRTTKCNFGRSAMRNQLLGLLGVSVLAATATAVGCSVNEAPYGAAGATNTAGSSNAAGTSAGGSTSGGGPAASCSNVSPCTGSVVGSWSV